MAKANQKQSNGSALNFDTQLGKVIDDAMGAIERENPTLKGVLPSDYARPSLSPVGIAGFILANSSMSTQSSNEGEIRNALIEADLVDCMVALPGQSIFSNN